LLSDIPPRCAYVYSLAYDYSDERPLRKNAELQKENGTTQLVTHLIIGQCPVPVMVQSMTESEIPYSQRLKFKASHSVFKPGLSDFQWDFGL